MLGLLCHVVTNLFVLIWFVGPQSERINSLLRGWFSRFCGRYLNRFDNFAARAAFGIEKPEKILERFRIGRIPEPLFILANGDQTLHSELLEVMRQRGIRYLEFTLYVADDHPVRVRRQQQPYDL